MKVGVPVGLKGVLSGTGRAMSTIPGPNTGLLGLEVWPSLTTNAPEHLELDKEIYKLKRFF